jgi:hypothetical protein
MIQQDHSNSGIQGAEAGPRWSAELACTCSSVERASARSAPGGGGAPEGVETMLPWRGQNRKKENDYASQPCGNAATEGACVRSKKRE